MKEKLEMIDGPIFIVLSPRGLSVILQLIG